MLYILNSHGVEKNSRENVNVATGEIVKTTAIDDVEGAWTVR